MSTARIPQPLRRPPRESVFPAPHIRRISSTQYPRNRYVRAPCGEYAPDLVCFITPFVVSNSS